MKLCLILLLVQVVSFTSFGSVQRDNIVRGNQAYSAGSYTMAAEQYKKVVDAGYESPELFYNVGNTYFKMNDYASAILWYERARRLDPGNEDINFNLIVANTKISDKIEPLPVVFYKRWFTGVVQIFSVDIWAIMGVCMFIAGLFSLLLYIASRVLLLRKIGFWLGNGLFILTAFALIFAWNGYRYSKLTNEAIVFAPTITVKSSPDDKSTDLFVLHEGAKVSLLDNISGWYEIRIANGSVGWLPETSLEKI
ncbi:MAG: tetratricopeptide repeat protein [Bacteroidales bacterium]|nr:tetratricopeptide repeat protein [Bacteroidales bacterium]